MIKYKILSAFIFLVTFNLNAQFGIGVVGGIDLYQWYQTNDDQLPSTDENSHSAGSAILNLNLGPKIWVGGPKFSVSAEAQASYAPFALDIGDYKGLGAVAFPMSIDLNFGGLSAFNPLVNKGFSIGGGILYKKSELYFVEDEYSDLRENKFDRAFFGQIGYGIGAGGLVGKLYARYATEGDNNSFFSIGMNFEMNLVRNNFEVDQDELYGQ